jgi:hypothetical protein
MLEAGDHDADVAAGPSSRGGMRIRAFFSRF